MKIYALLLGCVLLACPAKAQQTPAEAPATKEDVQRFFEVMHTRETMQAVMDAMTKQMHQMTHQQAEANAGKLPPDFEERMNRMTDEMLKAIPFDEMFDIMIPIYQKHLTKADVDAMVAFYSTPTGQKVIREMPAMTQEAMQAIMPLMQKQMARMQQRLQDEIAQIVKQSGGKPQPVRP